MNLYALLKKPIKNYKSINWSSTDLEHYQEMSIPDILIIYEDKVETGGYFLFRYTFDNEFCGDTWHETLEYAKGQAEFEYSDSVGNWEKLPDYLDNKDNIVEYINNQLKKN